MHITPSMQQYLDLKKQYKDCILLFQMGDFYETFFDDAKIVSKELNIILTSREKKNPIPMAGFPIKAIDSYLPKLIKRGYKVAIAEQIEDPKITKGLVKRKIIEVVTNSTLLDDNLNNSAIPRQTAGIIIDNKIITTAISNISESIISISKTSLKDLKDLLTTQNVTEIVLNNHKYPSHILPAHIPTTIIKPVQVTKAISYLLKHFNTPNLMSIGLEENKNDIQAIYLLLKYFETLKGQPAKNISKIQYQSYDKRIYLDSITLNNLEILTSSSNNPTLFSILNNTKTPMGTRLLYKNLQNPSKDMKELKYRLDLVEYFNNSAQLTDGIRNILIDIIDIEKISSLIVFNRIKPQQIIRLKNSLQNINKLFNLIKTKTKIQKLNKLITRPQKIQDIINLIEFYINDNLDNLLTEGHIINANSFPKIKELRNIVYNIQTILETYRKEIETQFNLDRLKVGFNKVYGYFFEIPKTQTNKLPAEFTQKQTLVNNLRFTTPKLQELEHKIQTAEEELFMLEKKIYTELISKLKEFITDFHEIAYYVAYIDFITNGAFLANHYNYVKPKLVNKKTTKIIKGRHPIIERIVEEFIPNSINLNNSRTFVVLTGPNMGGKSTFIRQIALIQIMTQIGYFIPAQKATLSIKDRIFARVGASDKLAKNMSTFMVEMSEVANILNNATEKSLIILDELGRGTSTLEGISIAQAISEYIVTQLKAHTLLTTHYYELVNLGKKYPSIQNLKVDVYEDNNTVIFLHTIKKGIAEKSYGIHIAKMVDLPHVIIKRAQTILNKLNQDTLPLRNLQTPSNYNMKKIYSKSKQELLPIQIESQSSCKDIIKKLKKIQIEKTTPLKALEFLNELKKLILK